LDEARQITEQALAKFPTDEAAHYGAYIVALDTGRAADAQRELDWVKGKPGEARFVFERASMEAQAGKLGAARELARQAIEIQNNHGMKEAAETSAGVLAEVEADFGACPEALKNAGTIGANAGDIAKILAGSTFAQCGEAKKADKVVDELAQKHPLDTFAKKVDIPGIRALEALQRGDGAKAIEELRAGATYDFGRVAGGVPAYLRGLAYLKMKQGGLAAAEFQKFIDHKGVTGASPLLGLVKLGLARALVLSGDTAKARTAYQDFFAMWKDADGDVPVLKAAKAEYEKLK
jgi:tetratricopeptide (TPR) repeat protein